MARAGAGRVEVCTASGAVQVRVTGRATHLISQPLRDYGLKMIRRGLRAFTFDLAGCVYLDSTFAGLLAGLALRLKDAGGTVTLCQAPPRCRELIATLGIENLFAFDDHACRGAQMEALPAAARSREAWAGTILEAHRVLARADKSNEGQFEDVLEFLRTELPSAVGNEKLKH